MRSTAVLTPFTLPSQNTNMQTFGCGPPNKVLESYGPGGVLVAIVASFSSRIRGYCTTPSTWATPVGGMPARREKVLALLPEKTLRSSFLPSRDPGRMCFSPTRRVLLVPSMILAKEITPVQLTMTVFSGEVLKPPVMVLPFGSTPVAWATVMTPLGRLFVESLPPLHA